MRDEIGTILGDGPDLNIVPSHSWEDADSADSLVAEDWVFGDAGATGPRIAQIVAAAATPNGGDEVIRGQLRDAGFAVTMCSDEDPELPVDAYDGYVISPSCSSSVVLAKYATSIRPGLVIDEALLDEHGMSATLTAAVAVSTWDTVESGALDAGLVGATTVYSVATTQQGATVSGLGAGAVVVATRGGDPAAATYFYYPAGSLLVGGGTAPAKRVGFLLASAGEPNLNANGLSLLREAMVYAFDSAGAAHTRTVADPVGAVDAAVGVQGHTRAVTDPVGAVDAAAGAQGFALTVTDPVGAVDAATGVQGLASLTVTDPVGAVDAATGVQGHTRSVTDPVGAVDAATPVVAHVRSVADPVGAVDTLAPAGRAFTRFVGLTAGQPAPGWTAFGPAPFAQAVQVDAFGEAHMRVQKTGSGIGGLTWDDVPVVADTEVYVEVQSTSGSTLSGRFKAGVRMDPAAVTTYLGGHGQASRSRLFKYIPASTAMVQSAVANYPAGTRIRIRFQVSGTTLQVKVWTFGEHEPVTWETTATDTSLAAPGRVGMFSFGSSTSPTDTKVYAFGVGTGGNAAPRTHYAAPIWNQIPRQIGFPFTSDVAVSYINDWDELRDAGTRRHRGTDIFVAFGTPVYAMSPGTITSYMPGISESIVPGSGGGYSLYVDTPDNKLRIGYLHFGPNATGRAAEAFAPGIGPGVVVTQGQLLGWSGDSGSSGSGPHLHTDFRDLAADVTDDPYADYAAVVGSQDAPRFNPYSSLITATPLPGRTVTDPAGLLDAVTVVSDHTRTATDPAGLLDLTGTALGVGQVVTDPAGLVDAVAPAQGHAREVFDPAGLLDTATAGSNTAREVFDPAGVVDVVIGNLGQGGALSDLLGITDTATGVAATTRPAADLLGIAEQVFAEQLHVRAVTDLLGVVDAAAGTAGATRAVTDSAASLDVVSPSSETQRVVVEPFGLLEQLGQVATQDRAVLDPAGVLDLTVMGQGHARDAFDLLGLFDTAAQTTAAARTATEPVGLLDAAAAAQDWTRSVADLLATVDTATADRDLVAGIVDVLGLGDEQGAAQGWARAVAELAGIVDDQAAAQGYARGVLDPLGALDLLAQVAAAERAMADPLGVADVAAAGQGWARAATDVVDQVDNIGRVGTFACALLDLLDVVDDTTSVGGRPVVLIPGRHVATAGSSKFHLSAASTRLEART